MNNARLYCAHAMRHSYRIKCDTVCTRCARYYRPRMHTYDTFMKRGILMPTSDTYYLTDRIPSFRMLPEHIGILPRDGSTYYAWYDDGRGRVNENYLFEFCLERREDALYLVTTSEHDMTYNLPNTAPVTPDLFASTLRGRQLAFELSDDERLSVARAVRAICVSQALAITEWQDEHRTLGDIPRDVHNPDFVRARHARVALQRRLRSTHLSISLRARRLNETTTRIEERHPRPSINYSRFG